MHGTSQVGACTARPGGWRYGRGAGGRVAVRTWCERAGGGTVVYSGRCVWLPLHGAGRRTRGIRRPTQLQGRTLFAVHLAVQVTPDQYLNTEPFMDAIAETFARKRGGVPK